MAQTISISVPDAIANEYESPDELKQGLYEDIIVRSFQKGILSIRECAKILGMTYEQFIEWLTERQISFITATEEELDESHARFESFMNSRNGSWL